MMLNKAVLCFQRFKVSWRQDCRCDCCGGIDVCLWKKMVSSLVRKQALSQRARRSLLSAIQENSHLGMCSQFH